MGSGLMHVEKVLTQVPQADMAESFCCGTSKDHSTS